LNTLHLLGVLGWTTAFHLVSNWGETSFRQPDLQKAGILKTILILPVMNLLCYGSVWLSLPEEAKDSAAFGFRASPKLFR
jgi:hypothetical protein